jgi:hypothetical protein
MTDHMDDTTPTITDGPKMFTLKQASQVAEREEAGTKVMLTDEQGEPLWTADDNGAPVQAYAVVVGKLSRTYRKAEQAVQDRMLKRRTTELTSSVLARNANELVAACVTEWNLRDGTTPIPLTKDNVVQVLQVAPWIRELLDRAMGDSSRFLA